MKKILLLVTVILGIMITSCTKEETVQPQTKIENPVNPFGLTFTNLEGTFKNGTYPYDFTIYSEDSCISWQRTDLSKRYPTKYVIKNDTMTFYIKREVGSTNLVYFKCKFSNDTLYGKAQLNDPSINIIGIKQ